VVLALHFGVSCTFVTSLETQQSHCLVLLGLQLQSEELSVRLAAVTLLDGCWQLQLDLSVPLTVRLTHWHGSFVKVALH
jgi:hypothetical protein